MYNQRCLSFYSKRQLFPAQSTQPQTLFTADATVSSAARALGIGRKALTNFFDNSRGVRSDFLTWDPIEFADCGEFEVDECLIRHVKDSEHDTFVDVWIAGILERSSGKVLLYRVPDRSTQSLAPPILGAIPEGSLIYSDELKSYNELDRHTYEHYTVNRSRAQSMLLVEGLSVYTSTLWRVSGLP